MRSPSTSHYTYVKPIVLEVPPIPTQRTIFQPAGRARRSIERGVGRARARGAASLSRSLAPARGLRLIISQYARDSEFGSRAYPKNTMHASMLYVCLLVSWSARQENSSETLAGTPRDDSFTDRSLPAHRSFVWYRSARGAWLAAHARCAVRGAYSACRLRVRRD